jgi:hypothetical protein
MLDYDVSRYCLSLCHSHRISSCFLIILLLPVFWVLPSVAALESFGTWRSTLTANLALESIEAKSDLSAGLEMSGCEMRMRTVVDRGDWRQQNLTVLCTLGQVDIKSDLRFEPHLHRFRDWITRLRWRDDATILTLTPKLTRSTNWLLLEVEHKASLGELSARGRWRAPTGSCVLLFYDTEVGISFSCCGIDSEVEIALKHDGFDAYTVSLSGLTFDTIPWLSLDLELTHSIDATIMTVEHDLSMTITPCSNALDLTLLAIWGSPSALSGLRVSKATLSWAIENWNLDVIASFDKEDWIRKTYWLRGKARGSFRLGYSGTLTTELVSLWTEDSLGELSFCLTHKQTPRRTFALSWSLHPQEKRLDTVSLLAQVKW